LNRCSTQAGIETANRSLELIQMALGHADVQATDPAMFAAMRQDIARCAQ